MNWANPIFLIPLITGPFFIMAGILMAKFPPKDINNIYGYRTKRSMKSQESWDFAQLFSAKRLIYSGIILMICSIIGSFIRTTELLAVVIGLLSVIVAAAIPIVKTEIELNSRFK
jgi:uncharacterized membrane protein